MADTGKGAGKLHWRQARELFDALCELPREQWQKVLDQRCSDPALAEEVLQLLDAQTEGLRRVNDHLGMALALALAPELDAGQRLGPWRLTERIARGGMGTVFKAERDDGLYQRTVAIKLLHGLPGAGEVEQLQAERQVLAGLRLPDVAQLYDGGTTPDGYPYLVMEYVDGLPLDRHCAIHALGLEQRLRLFLDVCAIVRSAHEHLVLHCDLKPSNVLVRGDGRPVLLDFGLARLLNDARDRRQGGYCTPAYASPELVRGEHVGVAGDVYSLGVMLVELLSTRACGRGVQDIDVPVASPSANAPAGLRWYKALAGDLDAIAGKACALDTARRYRSVEALMADVSRYLQRQPVLAREGGRSYRLLRGMQRNWRGLAAGVVALSLAGLFVAGLVQARRQAEEEAAIARQVGDFMVGVFEIADPFLRTERGQEELSSRQLLDKAALRVARDLADAPAQLARMRMVLGTAYRNSGVPHQAEVLLQQAHDGFMDPRVDRPVDAAAALAELSVQKTRDGDGVQGNTLAERGLALLPGTGAGMVRARLHLARGLALVNQQHFDRGEAAFDTTMMLYGRQPEGSATTQVLELAYNKGLMYLRWGRLAQAEREFRRVLDGVHGRRTSMVLATEMRLAQVLREQGRFAQALPLLQSGMRHARELYGPQSSFVLMQHDGLADLYMDAGDYAAAEREYLQRHRLSALIDGTGSVEYSMGLFNYGTLQELRGDVAQAERLYRQAWTLRKERLGEDSPTSLRAESGLGALLARQGRMDEAGQLLLHADAGLDAALPADAPGRIEARLNRIGWHVLRGELEQARALLGALDARIPAILQLRLLRIRADLAERQGEGAAALALRRTALEFARVQHGQDGIEIAVCRTELAETLLRLGHRQPALDALRQAVPVLARLQVEAAPERRKAEGLKLLAGAQQG
ncbi:serine/threonine-protein kinase [Stenotrophomonas sp. NLF4-10]|uniref:serine/threonine-protein kinase n=1 Tax=Stenotrophomonas sp. NLF4-10 TaxID=2918754 RepID=UPI001EFBBC3B|nr:serine/threonine-protein kinase [Stenotrophomonas sp. NLF4-10]MCG8276288.1 protein kinase [Stenotrophomonas sp. NLF4-10]